jgi:hypothetical protein
MDTYAFAIRVTGINPDSDASEVALYEAGCDDAVIAVIVGGMRLDFDREAESYGIAVSSAIRDVKRAGARVLSVEPREPKSRGSVGGINAQPAAGEV